MKLFVDLETLELIEGPGFRNPVSTLRFKRGDGARLEVMFLRNGSTPQVLGDPAGLSLQFGVKPRGRYDLGYLAQSSDWTLPAANADTPFYECSPSFNTVELNAALQIDTPGQNELPEILLMGEITWSQGGGEPTSTRTFLVLVENDVNRGDESAPQPSPTVEDWLDQRALRHDKPQALSLAAQNQARANAGAAADLRNLPEIQRHFPENPPYATHYVITQDDVGKRIIVPDGYLGGLSIELSNQSADDPDVEIGQPGDVLAVDFQETGAVELSITREGLSQLWVFPGIHYFRRGEPGWAYIGNNYEVTRFPASMQSLAETNTALASLEDSAVKLTGSQTIAGQKTFTAAPRSTGILESATSLITYEQTERNKIFRGFSQQEYFPSVAGSPANGSATAIAGNYADISLGFSATAIGRLWLARNFGHHLGSGATYTFDRNLLVGVFASFYLSSIATTQCHRVYIGHNGLDTEIPYFGSDPVPENRSSIGVEIRVKPASNGQLQIRLFARDGWTTAPVQAGTMLLSDWYDYGADTNSLNSLTYLVIEHLPSIKTVRLYLSHLSVASSEAVTPTSQTPVLTISGDGVPFERKTCATNWASILSAAVPNGVDVPVSSSICQQAIRSTRVYFP